MIEYYIDNVNIKTAFGVYVSSSSGVIGMPKKKAARKQSYANLHGDYVDLSAPRYESRTISLSCFIKATSKIEFLAKFDAFVRLVNKSGLHRLEIALDGQKMLFYEVYNEDAVDVTKKWSDNLQLGTFTMKLIEPNPVKMIYLAILERNDVSIRISCTDRVHIFWGDGLVDYDVRSGQVVEHEYSSIEDKVYIVFAGAADSVDEVVAEGAELIEIDYNNPEAFSDNEDN